MIEPFQPALDLSLPLQDATFIVVDLETTAGSARGTIETVAAGRRDAGSPLGRASDGAATGA